MTNTRRTQQTAAGLAQRLGLKPEVVDAKTDSAELARRVLRENRGRPGAHRRTQQHRARRSSPRWLASNNVPPIGEEEFDTMYVVTVPTIGKASVLRLKY